MEFHIADTFTDSDFSLVPGRESNKRLHALQILAIRKLHFRVTPKVTPLFSTLPP